MNPARRLIGKVTYLLPRLILLLIPALYVLFALLTYFDYFEAYLYPLHFIQGKASKVSDRIIIGPYPHFEELKKLKEDYGVSIAVSLLNVNLPQEKALYEREKKSAEMLGMVSVSFPMEYFPLESSSNRKVLRDVVGFIRSHKAGRLYIHCYLGKHRVGLVKKVLSREGLIRDDRSKDVVLP